MAMQFDDSLSQASTEGDESITSADTSSETISAEKDFTVEELKKLSKRKLSPVALTVNAVFVKHPGFFKICRDKRTGVSFKGVADAMFTDNLEPRMSKRTIQRLLDIWRSVAELGKLPFTMLIDLCGLFGEDRLDFYEILRETGGIMDDPPMNIFQGKPIENESGAASVWPKVRGPIDIWTGSDSGVRVQLVDETSGTTTTISSQELGIRLNEEFIRLPKEERLKIACESVPKPEETRAVRQALRDQHFANMETRQEAANALARDLKIQDSGWRKLQRGAGVHRSPHAPITVDSTGSNLIRVFQESFLAVPDAVCERSVERTSKDTLVFQLRLRPYQVVNGPTADNGGETSNENQPNLGRFLQIHQAFVSMSMMDVGISPEQISAFFARADINLVSFGAEP